MRILGRRNLFLWAGDLITAGVLTVIGFASHDQLTAGGVRFAATFIPIVTAWVFVALPSGLLAADAAVQPSSLLRTAWAMSLAGILAAVMRGLILNRPVPPVFSLVLSGSAVIAILVWRTIFLFAVRSVK